MLTETTIHGKHALLAGNPLPPQIVRRGVFTLRPLMAETLVLCFYAAGRHHLCYEQMLEPQPYKPNEWVP